LREEIMDVARDLFVREGYHNVSMRRIATQIEYSPTTIYLHFKDKAHLLHSISEGAFTSLADTLESMSGEEPLARLRDGCRAYITFGLDHPNHYRLLFMSPDSDPLEGIAPAPASRRAFDYLRRGVAACIEAEIFVLRDVETISQSIWCLLHGLTSLLITKTEFAWIDRETLIETTLETMLRGLTSPQPITTLRAEKDANDLFT